MRFVSLWLAQRFGAQAGETLSAMLWRMEQSGRAVRWLRRFVDILSFQPDHCRRAHEKRTMPIELAPVEEAPRVTLAFTPDAIQMILEALGHLPLARSRMLYDAIEQQAREQLKDKGT